MQCRIITISREYGSGGRLIGKMIAEELGIAFYDKELLMLVAKESGFSLDYIEETGEYTSTASSLLFNLAMSNAYKYNVYSENVLPPQDRIHILQKNIICDIAKKEPCVIVGRCADYILQNRKDVLNVFIHANTDSKKERIINQYGIEPDKAEKELRTKDKGRAKHYEQYTNQKWGMAKNYHISLNSGIFSMEKCKAIITELYIKK